MFSRADAKVYRLTLLLTLTLVGGWLRFTAISFGLPDKFRPDEEIMVPRALNLGPDWNPHMAMYPPALMYMQSAALRAYAAALGKASGFRSVYPADNGALAYLIARRVTAALGTATIPALYIAAAPIYGPGAALSAAAIVAVTTIHVQDSKFAKVDVAAAFWTTMALAMLLRIVSCGRWYYYLAAGVFSGLAIATKYPSSAILFGIAWAHLEARRREGSAGIREALRDSRMYMVVVGAVAATFCAAPFLFLDWRQTVRDFKLQWAQSFPAVQCPHGWRWLLFTAMPDSFGLGILSLLIGGFLWALVRRKRGMLSLVVFLVVAFFPIATVHRAFYRYLILPLPAMAILSGVLVSDLTLCSLRLGDGRRVVTAAVVLALILVPSLIRDVQLDRILLQTDTRTLARRWIQTHVPPTSAIAVTGDWRYPYGKPQLLSNRFVPMEDLVTLRRRNVQWILSDSLGALRSYSPGLSPEQESEISMRATLVFDVDPMRYGTPRLPIFDAGDAFYAPLGNAASMVRPGPRIRIWKLK